MRAKLQQAIGLHQAGQLAEAQIIYEEILKMQPGHFDALYLLGIIAKQAKNFVDGEDTFPPLHTSRSDSIGQRDHPF
jgi:hypothetical protein